MKKKSFAINKILIIACYLAAILMFASALWQLLTHFADKSTQMMCYGGIALVVAGLILKAVLNARCKKQYLMLEEARAKQIAAAEQERRQREYIEEMKRREIEEQQRAEALAYEQLRRRQNEMMRMQEMEDMFERQLEYAVMSEAWASYDYEEPKEEKKKERPYWG